ncbi:MAG: hypothetical protein HYW27_00010 [Candidatus Aenigmarchaeota archaeon]|nr:hypothetical protein [Candidatus Aenigmarchaeota archaeon]
MIISKEMTELIARSIGHTDISIKTHEYVDGKFDGWLIIRNSKNPPRISTNAVFKSREAAATHMAALVTRIQEEAILGH